MLVQPTGLVVNALGEHPFGGTWHAGTQLSAKTGSDDAEDASGVRWIVGHVQRQARSWVFVSLVTGRNLDPFAAVDLAAQALTEASVL
jgi:beta-lactamase class D